MLILAHNAQTVGCIAGMHAFGQAFPAKKIPSHDLQHAEEARASNGSLFHSSTPFLTPDAALNKNVWSRYTQKLCG